MQPIPRTPTVVLEPIPASPAIENLPEYLARRNPNMQAPIPHRMFYALFPPELAKRVRTVYELNMNFRTKEEFLMEARKRQFRHVFMNELQLPQKVPK